MPHLLIRRRRAILTAGLLSLPCLVLTAQPALPAPQPDGAFVGIAAADGVRVTIGMPGFAAVRDFVDAGGPTAQANVDSFGTSVGFAAWPNPGDVAIASSGLAKAVGFPVDIPPYPFYVSSSYPTQPEATTGNGPYALKATSTELTSTASAQSGADGDTRAGLTRSTASVTREARGDLVADSVTQVEVFAAGPLRITGLRSHARVVRGPAGTRETASDLAMSSITIGDQSVGLGPKGFTLAGQTVPLPPADPALRTLQQSGMKVRLLPEEKTSGQVLSPAVQVSGTFPVPGANRQAEVTYLLGRAFSLVDIRAPETPLPNLDEPLPYFPEGRTAPAGGFDQPVIRTIPTERPSGPLTRTGAGDREGSVVATDASSAATVPGGPLDRARSIALAAPTAQTANTTRPPLIALDTSIYPVLALITVVLLGATQVLRGSAKTRHSRGEVRT